MAAAAQQQARSAKIAQYERFIGERLMPDFMAAEEAKGKVQRDIDTWEALVTNVRGVQEQGQEELRTMVDLGTQVYCQAEVPDTSRIFVCVGLGFHAEMTLVSGFPPNPRRRRRAALQRERSKEKKKLLNTKNINKKIHKGPPNSLPFSPCLTYAHEQDEALAFADKKLLGLREDLKRRVDELANIQSHVKLVTEGIRELMMLPPE